MMVKGAVPSAVRPPEGGIWNIGGVKFRTNPRFEIPPAIFHVVGLWQRCQGGMGGLACLPEPGGVNAQPAWLMAAFSMLNSALSELSKQKSNSAS